MRATLRGTATVGDQIATDIVASPLVRITGDVRVAGRTAKGLTLMKVTRTDANGVFTGTVAGAMRAVSVDGGQRMAAAARAADHAAQLRPAA